MGLASAETADEEPETEGGGVATVAVVEEAIEEVEEAVAEGELTVEEAGAADETAGDEVAEGARDDA